MNKNFMNSERMLTVRRKGLAAAISATAVATVAMNAAMSAFATTAGEVNLDDVTTPITGLLKSVLNYVIILVAAVGAIFCVTLGVKFARAEEPQEREKAKQHLKNAIIGYVLIFILVVALRVGTPILTEWMNNNS
jgi:phosphotransferase system  glucose/maltose/N-acetylglucosamine-specific IIC component